MFTFYTLKTSTSRSCNLTTLGAAVTSNCSALVMPDSVIQSPAIITSSFSRTQSAPKSCRCWLASHNVFLVAASVTGVIHSPSGRSVSCKGVLGVKPRPGKTGSLNKPRVPTTLTLTEGSKVYFNPKSMNVVILKEDGNFLSGWKINPDADNGRIYLQTGDL